MSLGQVELHCKRCGRLVELPLRKLSAGVRCTRCGFVFAPSPAVRAPASMPAPDLTSTSGQPLALRSDLVIEPVEEAGETYFVIKDPADLRFFRVKPLEHFLITQFDGMTPEDEIRRRAADAHRVLVTPEVLARFARKFQDLGLLVSAGESGPADRARLPRLFHLKLPLVNPEPLLDVLYQRFRWVFRPWAVFTMALTVVVALLVVASNRDALALGSIFSAEGFLLVYATVSVVTVFHELAHGLTCRHFGGRVQDMGVLLLYFVPCFYCNVSDAYLFKEKRKRFWVTFAGAYFELYLWALAVLAWRVLAPDSFVSRVLLVVIAVCGVKSLLNLNPLIKLDGYYLLVDALGVTNLRKEALAGLARSARRLLRLESSPPRRDIARRRILALPADRFLTLFGAAALLYTIGFVASMVLWSGGAVFERFGGTGLGLFALVLGGVLQRPASVAASGLRSVSREKWVDLGKRRKRLRSVLLWVGLPIAVGLIPWELRIASNLVVLPFDRATVRAPAEGRVLRILFTEGQRVKKGDLLLEYDDRVLLIDRQTKQAELSRSRQELRLLEKRNPTWREETRVEERALETALAREGAAREELERARQLWTLGLLARDKLDQAAHVLENAENETRKQRAQSELVTKSSRSSRNEQMEVLHLRDPDAQKAVIQRLEAELERLEDLIGRTRIYAPLSGTLVTYRFQEKIGEYLEEGGVVCDIVDDQRVVVEMPISEKDIDVVHVGNPVKFKVRGYPDRSFFAQVAEIAPVATPSGSRDKASTILIRATVDNPDGALKPDMTGVAKVYCGGSFVARVLTRDLVRFIRTEFWF